MEDPEGLNKTYMLKGTVDERYQGKVTHYYGVKYADVHERFGSPVLVSNFPKDRTEFTKFGPRPPEPPKDGGLLSIPKHLPENTLAEQDEFNCLNLNITCPTINPGTTYPVLIWIHGGGFAFSYPSPQQKISDCGPFVAQSIELGKPTILITIQYRLNLFGFGDGKTGKSLYFQDLQAGISFVKENISLFGGNPNNITVGGESAGGIATHGLVAAGTPEFQRAILDSGSFYLTPPRPDITSKAFVKMAEGYLQTLASEGKIPKDQATLAKAPVSALAETVNHFDIFSLWFWDMPYFKDWRDNGKLFKNMKSVMVGDCQDEGRTYAKTLTRFDAAGIIKCFDTKTHPGGMEIAKAYGMLELKNDDHACREAALNFLTDARFALPNQEMAEDINNAGVKAYQYYFDEVNPFQPKESASAHHAVDVFSVFGAYDADVNEGMRNVGKAFRKGLIDFANGDDPWSTDDVYMFGPNGTTGAAKRPPKAETNAQVFSRRRHDKFRVLEKAGFEVIWEAWTNLILYGDLLKNGSSGF